MELYEDLTPKQKRTIGRDINLISSLKGLLFPKTIEDIKEIGVFSTRVRIKEDDVYLSGAGKNSLRRICDIAHDSNKYRDLLNYNDIFQSVLSELGRWFSNGQIPDAEEFIVSLDKLLLESIKKIQYSCRIDGIYLDGVTSIKIGNREIKVYSNSDLNEVPYASEGTKNKIDDEYKGCLIITGTEHGSKAVSLEKYYHNAELSLSILRLYSCAFIHQAIHKVNIRLINNCAHSYGIASSFGQEESSKSLIFTRYFKSTQDFKIEKEFLDYLDRDVFFADISSLVDKKNRSELESAIVKSLYWIGESQKDNSNPSKFVKLWSSLECFFTLGDGEITERNARGISSMLIYGGFKHEQYNDYEQLKSKIKKFYKMRSKIVHHAEYSQIDDIQLEEMAYISSWVIIAMVNLVKRGYIKLSEIESEAQRQDSRLERIKREGGGSPN